MNFFKSKNVCPAHRWGTIRYTVAGEWFQVSTMIITPHMTHNMDSVCVRVYVYMRCSVDFIIIHAEQSMRRWRRSNRISTVIYGWRWVGCIVSEIIGTDIISLMCCLAEIHSTTRVPLVICMYFATPITTRVEFRDVKALNPSLVVAIIFQLDITNILCYFKWN